MPGGLTMMFGKNLIMTTDPSKRKFTAAELIPGKTYRVLREFVDYDGHSHEAGESWSFVSHSFLPYDDGLILYVKREGTNHVFRLQWRTESQGQIISDFSDFVREL